MPRASLRQWVEHHRKIVIRRKDEAEGQHEKMSQTYYAGQLDILNLLERQVHPAELDQVDGD